MADAIPGWFDFSDVYDGALMRSRDGDTLVEVGVWKGASLAYLLNGARAMGRQVRVVGVDHFKGDAGAPAVSAAECRANLDTAGYPYELLEVPSEEAAAQFEDASVSFVFIDAAHDEESVRRDIQAWLPKVRPGGILAGHDFDYPSVRRAVDDLLGTNALQVGRSWVFQVGEPQYRPGGDEAVVYLGMPHHTRQVDIGAAQGLFGTPCRPGRVRCTPAHYQSSLLANAFNVLWTQALMHREDMGITHFAMIHSDIEPEWWWLDVLYDEMLRTGADVVSAVVPIKGREGITSTGLIDPNDPQRLVRRLSLREVHQLPETFCADDVPGGKGQVLAINTGLWLADLRKPWVENICFRISDRITKEQFQGKERPSFVASSMPEDWQFSQDLWEAGCKVYATRKVRLTHHGDAGYTNDLWGSWKTDHVYTAIRQKGFAETGELANIDDTAAAAALS